MKSLMVCLFVFLSLALLVDASKSSKSGSSKSTKEHTSGKSSKSNNSKKAPNKPKKPVSSLTCQSLQVEEYCKKDVLCQWNERVKMCLPRFDPVGNICLKKPEDIYRTCFQRAVDPSNDLTKDTVLRHEYNLGALMYQQGQQSSVSTLSYLEPYTPVYVTSNELLTYGSMYLSMVTNIRVSDLTCDDKVVLEEVTLEWLRDNVGEPDTYFNGCVFIDGYEFYEEFDNETQANIATAAFKVDFVFVTEKSWYYYDDGTSQRRLGKPGKNPKQEQLHGNVNAVNYKGKRGQEVKYRKWYGSKDRRSMRPLRGANCFQSSLQRNFANVDFNDIIGRYTDRSPVEIGAVLNATSLKDLAVCRANNYNVFESESPLLGCREYNEFQCDLNDYIIMNGTERCSVNAGRIAVQYHRLRVPQRSDY